MTYPSSIRFRMMLLFCAVVGVLLALSYTGVYLMFQRFVQSQLDRKLQETAGPIVSDLIQDFEEHEDKDIDRLDIPGQYFEVIDASGHIVQKSLNLRIELPLDLNQSFQNISTTETGTLHVGLFPFSAKDKPMYLVVGASTHDVDAALTTLRRTAVIVFAIALALTALISGIFAARSLKPIAEVTRQASAMIEELSPSPASGSVSMSEPASRDELYQLTVTFNALFQKLHAVLGQLRQFVSDAAHELRTPLAILRGETELLLARPRTTEEYEKSIRIIDSELKTLNHIVDALFTLSMADAGQLHIAPEPLYLDEILEETCALAAPLASQKRIRFEKTLQHDVHVSGDAAFLRQLFLIFIDNAIKYSPDGSRLEVRLSEDRRLGRVRVQFQDHGIGIAREHLPHIFERFYRAAQGDSSGTQSGGLGLAIAQAIVHAHHGTVECESESGSGSTFTIFLPIKAVPA